MRLLDFLTRNVEGAVLIRKTKNTFQSQIHSFGERRNFSWANSPTNRPCELFSSRNFALAEVLVGCESLQLKKNNEQNIMKNLKRKTLSSIVQCQQWVITQMWKLGIVFELITPLYLPFFYPTLFSLHFLHFSPFGLCFRPVGSFYTVPSPTDLYPVGKSNFSTLVTANIDNSTGISSSFSPSKASSTEVRWSMQRLRTFNLNSKHCRSIFRTAQMICA